MGEGEDLMQVEEIIDTCVVEGGKRLYHVKWKPIWVSGEQLPSKVIENAEGEKATNDGVYVFLDERTNEEGVVEYLLSYSSTWEAEKKLIASCPDLLSSFWSSPSHASGIIEQEVKEVDDRENEVNFCTESNIHKEKVVVEGDGYTILTYGKLKDADKHIKRVKLNQIRFEEESSKHVSNDYRTLFSSLSDMHDNDHVYEEKYSPNGNNKEEVVSNEETFSQYNDDTSYPVNSNTFQDFDLKKPKAKLSPKKRLCDTCGKYFSTKSNLNRHRKKCGGGRLFYCEICGENFSMSFALIVHQRTHTKDIFRSDTGNSRNDSGHNWNDDLNSQNDNVHSPNEKVKSGNDKILSQDENVNSRNDNIESLGNNVNSQNDKIKSSNDIVNSENDSGNSQDNNVDSWNDEKNSPNNTSDNGDSPNISGGSLSDKKNFQNDKKNFQNKKKNFQNDKKNFQNDKKNFQNDKKNFQNDNKNFQNDNKNFQNDKKNFQNDNKNFQNDKKNFQNDNKNFQNDNKNFQNNKKNFQNDKKNTRDDTNSWNNTSKQFTNSYTLSEYQKVPMVSRCDRKYKCDKCWKHFSTKSNLNRHCKTCSVGKLFNCKVCGASFARSFNLKIHEKLHANEPFYQCDVCNQHCSSSLALNEHREMHDMRCFTNIPHIGNKQSTKQAYKRMEVLEKPFKGIIQNDTSTAKLTNSFTMKEYQQEHAGDRRYDCIKCAKKFSTKSNLNRHVKTCSGGKIFHCEVCNAPFTRSVNLKIHQRIHSNENRYQCDVCKKQCLTSYALLEHERVHTGVRPFKCATCGRQFTTKSNWKRHQLMYACKKTEKCEPQNTNKTCEPGLPNMEVVKISIDDSTLQLLKLKEVNNDENEDKCDEENHVSKKQNHVSKKQNHDLKEEIK